MNRTRRSLLAVPFACMARAATLTPRQRVDRALAGQDLDRPPISLWHHFGLEKQGGARHAEATLQFHRTYATDLVKVMSDFPFPKPAGAWWEVREQDNPFPEQVVALQAIAKGLAGSAHFVETIFNPWNVAEKLSSPDEVRRLMREQPQRLLDALEVIARSEASHVRRALAAGASGIFLAIANAQEGVLTREEYRKFSAPFDGMVLDAARSAPLNILHLHGDRVDLDEFLAGWPAPAINYSVHGTGIPFAQVRRKFAGVLLGGVDERDYRARTTERIRADIRLARAQAGPKLIVTPGCSVPDDSQPAELHRLAEAAALT